MSSESESARQDAARLESRLRDLGPVIVAFSGGVDSSTAAAAAAVVDLGSAIAVTADSPSVPRWQVELAKTVAGEIGINHRIISTREVDDSDYRVNNRDRCFHCKRNLYDELSSIAAMFSNATIVSGTNADDLRDYRPGIEAGRHRGVVTPLADLGFGKSRVRALAKHYGLSNHNLPASPCLASRIAYGVDVTTDRLYRIEQAEQWLRQRGFLECRVRLHHDELARIEVHRGELSRLLELDARGDLSEYLQRIGFRYVTFDLAGFRSGSMNRVLVPLEKLGDSRDSKGAKEATR